MLYGRFALTMSYHKKVNAVALSEHTQINFYCFVGTAIGRPQLVEKIIFY